jgi:hypothetical protein
MRFRSPATAAALYRPCRLEHTKTVNDLYYVGPQEKEQFLSFLNKKLRDRKLEALVRNLFRPSYGGNRNFTLIYTLGTKSSLFDKKRGAQESIDTVRRKSRALLLRV